MILSVSTWCAIFISLTFLNLIFFIRTIKLKKYMCIDALDTKNISDDLILQHDEEGKPNFGDVAAKAPFPPLDSPQNTKSKKSKKREKKKE